MQRLLLFAGLLFYGMSVYAQDTADDINKIKLSGKYFMAEATAATEADAKTMSFRNLMMNISEYCEEMEMEEMAEEKIRKYLLCKSIKRGNNVLVLSYVTKDIVNGTTAVEEVQTANEKVTTTDTPDIIKRICDIGSFASMQYLLDKARENGLIEAWGKYRMMSDTGRCYLVMVNADRHIVGVLSPVRNGVRTNVMTGNVIDAAGMNSFTNCAPMCVLVK